MLVTLIMIQISCYYCPGSRTIPAVGLGVDSFRNLKLLDNPWHNAEAYHFLMLSQRQLMSGQYKNKKYYVFRQLFGTSFLSVSD